MLLYEPGSRIDREIERDLSEHMVVRVAAGARLDEYEDYSDSADEDLDHLQDEFAALLNINDEVNLPRPRTGFENLWGYSHIGKSDPRVKNLGNSWVVSYNSVTSVLPVNSGATGLAAFYHHVVRTAAEELGNATASVERLEFAFNHLSLSLTSPAPIPWDWIIRFARAMSHSLDLSWTVLYSATARNAYWDVPIIKASLRIAGASRLAH